MSANPFSDLLTFLREVAFTGRSTLCEGAVVRQKHLKTHTASVGRQKPGISQNSCQNAFDHDKGQKSAFFGDVSPLDFLLLQGFSGESNRPLTPIHVKKYRDTPPISMAYFCKCMPSLWQKVVYTPPICITIRLPFVSRYFCGSIRVRGRWDTPKFSVYISTEIAPKCGEFCLISGRRKSVESCHVSGCHGFSAPMLMH